MPMVKRFLQLTVIRCHQGSPYIQYKLKTTINNNFINY